MNLKSNFINKPWGHEILLEKNKKFMFKQLYMKTGHQCSLQFHKKKIETIYIVKGKLKIYYGKKETNLKSKVFNKEKTITIKPGTIHRMQAIVDTVYLEASTPELKDVIRISDDYMRVN